MFDKSCQILSLCLMVSMMSVILTVRSSTAMSIRDLLKDVDVDKRATLYRRNMELRQILARIAAEQQMKKVFDVNNSNQPAISNSLKRASVRRSMSDSLRMCLWKVCPAAPWLINK